MATGGAGAQRACAARRHFERGGVTRGSPPSCAWRSAPPLSRLCACARPPPARGRCGGAGHWAVKGGGGGACAIMAAAGEEEEEAATAAEAEEGDGDEKALKRLEVRGRGPRRGDGEPLGAVWGGVKGAFGGGRGFSVRERGLFVRRGAFL